MQVRNLWSSICLDTAKTQGTKENEFSACRTDAGATRVISIGPDSRADENCMRKAIALARHGVLAGEGGPFGAVIAQNGRILASGWNRVVADSDPTAHAEIVSIRAACKTLNRFQLVGLTLYCSCEPCPMCLAAAHWARLDRVVFAAEASDAARIGFDDQRIREALQERGSQHRLRMEQRLRDEALEVFRLWREQPKRVPY